MTDQTKLAFYILPMFYLKMTTVRKVPVEDECSGISGFHCKKKWQISGHLQSHLEHGQNNNEFATIFDNQKLTKEM